MLANPSCVAGHSIGCLNEKVPYTQCFFFCFVFFLNLSVWSLPELSFSYFTKTKFSNPVRVFLFQFLKTLTMLCIYKHDI